MVVEKACIEDLSDAGVRESAQGGRFEGEAGERCAGRCASLEDFYSDFAIGIVLLSDIDDAEAAFTDLTEEAIGTDALGEIGNCRFG